MKPLTMVLAGLIGCGCAMAQDAGEGVLQLPDRPEGQIHDPGNWLPRLDAEVLEQRLGALRKADKIDITIAVLPSQPPVPPEVFARQLLGRWGEGDGQTLILHVAGDPEGPWLASGGRMVRLAGEVPTKEAMVEAKMRIEAVSGEREQILAAVEEMEDLLRFLSYRGRYYEERLRAVQASYQLNEMQGRLNRRIFLLAAVVGGVLLLLGAALVSVYWSRNRAPLWFPVTSWRLRFGAPYAGGNDAVMRLGGPERRNSLAPKGGSDG